MRRLLKAIGLATAFLALCVTGEARADRFELSLMAEDSPLKGGTVCFFAGDARSVGRMFLLNNDITCIPAEKVVTIPTGNWNIFAESDGFVSSHPYIFTVRENDSPRIDKTTLSLVPAGTIDVSRARDSLRQGEYIAFYIQNETRPKSPASLRPVRDDQMNVPLPADMTLVPLAVAQGNIVAVAEPVRISKGQTLVLEPFIRSADKTTAVVQITVDKEWLERTKELRETPEVLLTSATGDTFQPMLPLRGRNLWINSLVFFKGIPHGNATVSARGRLWQPIEARLSVEARAAQLFEPVIPLTPAGAVVVRWRIEQPTGSEGLRRTECSDVRDSAAGAETAQSAPSPSAVVVYKCQSPTPKDPSDCVIYGNAPLADGPFGDYVFEGLPEGDYTIELSRPPFLRKRDVRVNELEVTEEDFDLKISGVFGRVTRDGLPVQAKLKFGTLAKAVSDPETGEYFAEWESHRGSSGNRVDVIPCDGTKGLALLGFPDPESSRPFDIEFPGNSLSIEVVEAESGKPVSDARVLYGVARDKDERELPIDGVFEVDDKGNLTINEVSPIGFIDICADAEGYVKSCEERFQLGPREKKHLQLSLAKTAAHEGRLIFPSTVRGGHVRFVVDPGIVLASTNIAADGTFTYELSESRPDIYLVVSGINVPLFALPYSPPTPGEILTITPPSVPLSAITIARRTSTMPAPFTIRIGGLAIPGLILQVHQTSRNLPARVDASQPVRVPDIAATGPIAVIMGPESPLAVLTRSTNIYSDVFNTPGIASTLPVLAVGRDGAVVFP